MTLADFAAQPQAQTREAAILARVNTWSTAAAGGAYLTAAVAETGRHRPRRRAGISALQRPALCRVRAHRRTHDRRVDSRSRHESGVPGRGQFPELSRLGRRNRRATSIASGAVAAYRTSGFKDWYAVSSSGTGTNQYVNNLYTARQHRAARAGRSPVRTAISEDDHPRRVANAVGGQLHAQRRVDPALRAQRAVAESVRSAAQRTDGHDRPGARPRQRGRQRVRHERDRHRARLRALRRRQRTTPPTAARRPTARPA